MYTINTLFVVLSFLAKTTDDVLFAIDALKALYGDIIDELYFDDIRKAAKKAVKRISKKTLYDTDIKAIEYDFLRRLDIDGYTGRTRQFEDRVYIFEDEDNKWHFDALVNPYVQQSAAGDTDGDVDFGFTELNKKLSITANEIAATLKNK